MLAAAAARSCPPLYGRLIQCELIAFLLPILRFTPSVSVSPTQQLRDACNTSRYCNFATFKFSDTPGAAPCER